MLWERRDFECNHYRGAGSSPVIFRDLLLLHYDGSDLQYVVALDKRTGKTVWKTPRSIDFKDLGPDGKPQAEGDMRKAFATPQIITVDGAPLLISMGAKATYALRSADRQGAMARRGADEPLGQHAAGVGFRPGVSADRVSQGRAAGRAAGWPRRHHGDARRLAADPRRAQQAVGAAGRRPALHDDRRRASPAPSRRATGEVVWTGRIGGTHSASPVAADGRVYFFSEEGKTIVVEAGRTFKVLAENKLGDGFMASPAIAGKAFIVRSRTHHLIASKQRATDR